MKKTYIISLIILMFIFLGVVKADNDKVFIEEVNMIEKSDGAIVNNEPVVNGTKINFDVKFTKVGDYIKYKIIINNKDVEDYTLSPSDKMLDSYVKYEYSYENDNKVIVAGGRKAMFVTISYNKEIPEELYKDGKYNETHSTNLSFYNNRLPEEEAKEIVNPKTSTASIVIIVLAVVLSFIISFLLSSRKLRRYLGVFIIVLLLSSPLAVYAINTLFITINTKVEIVKVEENKFCFFNDDTATFEERDYEQGETWNMYLERTQEQELFGYFYGQPVVDCFNNYLKEHSGEGSVDYACESLMQENQIETSIDDLIRNKNEGCYILEKK